MAGDDSMKNTDANVLEGFGLQVDPFAATHESRFLLRSKPVRRAIDAVQTALGQGANLVLVAAPAGTGKTALMEAMGREIKDGVRTARVEDAGSTWAEIGQDVGEQLRLSGGRLSPGAMSTDGGPVHTFRVIVNRAERLSIDSIKHFAAYLELEAGAGKQVHKLQLVLLAAEVPGAKLFGWLSGRAHERVVLEPLDTEQTRRYVARRVQLSQATPRQLFSSDALERICQLTDGRPGAINELCRSALELAASRGTNVVDAETIGSAARRSKPEAAPPPTSAVLAPEPATSSPTAVSSDPFADVAPAAPRVVVVDSEQRTSRGTNGAVWAALCALLLGVIAGGGAFLYLREAPPAPEPVTRIVEVPVEVEKVVEVPVEVVKIVEVAKPAPPPKPRAPKPRPAKVVKPPPPAKPAPAPKVAPKKRTLGPIPAAAAVLDRALAKTRPGNHTRHVQLFEHAEQGAKLVRTLKLSRLEQKKRTMTLGVVTNPGAQSREHRFLSIEKQGQFEDERFAYRPARGEVEPLKGGQGEDPFEGTSFHYDDFRVRVSGQFVLHGIDRSRVDDRYFYTISAKPRYKVAYERAEFVIDALDETLVEVHYFKGRGLRPYRVVQYPRETMQAKGTALVPMRVISRDFEQGRIDEARVVKLALDTLPDRKYFTLTSIQGEELPLPNL